MIHGIISVLVAAVLAALLATQGAAAQAILLEGARVVAGDGSPPIENAALLVEGGIISRIGRKGDIALPAGGTRIGLDGKTMMPAIISTHVHPGFQKGLTYLAENFARETIMDDLNRERYFGISTAMSLGIERGDVMFQSGPIRRRGAPAVRSCCSLDAASVHPAPVRATRSMQTSPMR